MVVETYFSREHGEFLERIACPSCGSEDCRPYRTAHDRLFGQPGRYHVARCSSCEMAFTNPRPTFASLVRHYPAEYFCYEPPEALRGLRRFVLGGVTRGLIARRIRMLETAVGTLPPGTRVCDVGCSHGALLSAMREQRGCEVTGVDFNSEMVAHGARRQVPIVVGTLKDAGFAPGRFDIVTMTEYLEHEPDPKSVLEEARRVTRPGGYIVIEVPLISARGARLFGNYWSQLDLPRHLMFFTPRTLGRMLEETGYQVVRIDRAHGSVAMSLLHFLGYEGIGRMTARDIVLTALATLLLLPFLPFLDEFMFVVARAKEPELERRRLPGAPSTLDGAELAKPKRAA